MRSFILVNNELTLVIGGQVFTVTNEHPNFTKIKASLSGDMPDNELLDLVNNDVCGTVIGYLKKHAKGTAEYRDGDVYFNGQRMHNAVTNKVTELALQGFPFEHMLRFLENVKLNPDMNSQQELYDFLENKHLPITEDGYFLAYKAVKCDYMDKYTGKIDNSPGRVITMDRDLVDNNRNNQCSRGLHVGALDYVSNYANPNDKFIVVKVHPRDAVSVPKDSNFQKLRCCRYEVLHDLDDVMTYAIYNSEGQPLKNPSTTDVNMGEKFSRLDAYDDDIYDPDDVDSSEYDEDYEAYLDELEDDECYDDVFTTVNTASTALNVLQKWANGCCKDTVKQDADYGIKPDSSTQAGRRYWNYRNHGQFARKT